MCTLQKFTGNEKAACGTVAPAEENGKPTRMLSSQMGETAYAAPNTPRKRQIEQDALQRSLTTNPAASSIVNTFGAPLATEIAGCATDGETRAATLHNLLRTSACRPR